MKAYEDDLCHGCGWPRTYTMHKDAKTHWHASEAIRCHACTAKATKEDAAGKDGKLRPGAYFVARPDDGLWHAMTHPVLTYDDPDARWVTGASGTLYPPASVLRDDT